MAQRRSFTSQVYRAARLGDNVSATRRVPPGALRADQERDRGPVAGSTERAWGGGCGDEPHQ